MAERNEQDILALSALPAPLLSILYTEYTRWLRENGRFKAFFDWIEEHGRSFVDKILREWPVLGEGATRRVHLAPDMPVVAKVQLPEAVDLGMGYANALEQAAASRAHRRYLREPGMDVLAVPAPLGLSPGGGISFAEYIPTSTVIQKDLARESVSPFLRLAEPLRLGDYGYGPYESGDIGVVLGHNIGQRVRRLTSPASSRPVRQVVLYDLGGLAVTGEEALDLIRREVPEFLYSTPQGKFLRDRPLDIFSRMEIVPRTAIDALALPTDQAPLLTRNPFYVNPNAARRNVINDPWTRALIGHPEVRVTSYSFDRPAFRSALTP